MRFENSSGNRLSDRLNSVRFYLTVWGMACMFMLLSCNYLCFYYYYLFCFVFCFFILTIFIFLHSNESLFWVISLPFKASTNISNENMDVGKNSNWTCTQCMAFLWNCWRSHSADDISYSFTRPLWEDTHLQRHTLELQIRGGIEDNSKIIFLISHRKYTLWPLIRIVSARRFWKGVTISVFTEQ